VDRVEFKRPSIRTNLIDPQRIHREGPFGANVRGTSHTTPLEGIRRLNETSPVHETTRTINEIHGTLGHATVVESEAELAGVGA